MPWLCNEVYASDLQKDVKISGFSEEDQANLWHNATDGQSKSKQGLGQGSVLKLAANARWVGKKTKIDEEYTVPINSSLPLVNVEISDQEAAILPSKRSQLEVVNNDSGAESVPFLELTVDQ